MFLIWAFLVFAALLLFILFTDEDTFIHLTIAFGTLAYFIIAVALVILLM